MKRMIIAAAALSLFTGAVALADPPQGYDHDRQQDRHHDEHHDRDMHHDRDHDRGEHRDWDSGRYVRPHGYHVHHWRRGERLPPAYRAQGYIIPDYATYRLRPPPRGYYWVRVDNNAVLAAVATGAVIDVAVNLFH
jgi:Ni/Co efflux regulator RcnB